SDVGMLDRTGQTVTVFYDRERPERIVAPKNGRSMSPAGPLMKVGGALVMLVFLAFFGTLRQGMLRGSPFWAGCCVPPGAGSARGAGSEQDARLRRSATPGAGCPGPRRGRPRTRPAAGR